MGAPVIVEHVQRLTERRASRRPVGEVIRTATYDVAPIESAAIARASPLLAGGASPAGSQ